MRLKSFLSIFCVIFSAFVLCGFFQFDGKDELGLITSARAPKKTKKASKRFIIVQKASEVQLTSHPEDPQKRLLFLKDPSNQISYYKVQPNQNFGALTIRKYLWYCKMSKSMFNEKKSKNVIGHLSLQGAKANSLPYVFELYQPSYDKKENALCYPIIPLPGFEQKQFKTGDGILTIDLLVN